MVVWKLYESALLVARDQIDDAETLVGEAESRAEAAETARTTFEDGALGDGLPSIDVPSSELEAGIAAFELFRRAGLASSGGEARRLIRGGGGRVNDAAAQHETTEITLSDVNADGVIKLSAGRKRHVLVRPV